MEVVSRLVVPPGDTYVPAQVFAQHPEDPRRDVGERAARSQDSSDLGMDLLESIALVLHERSISPSDEVLVWTLATRRLRRQAAPLTARILHRL